MTIYNAKFINNTASASGGAIFNEGVLNIYDSVFKDNDASVYYGGAIYSSGIGILNCYNSNFTNNNALNSAYGYGGAINSWNSTIVGCNFNYNSARTGGAFAIASNGSIRNCSFNSNKAFGNGGAIRISGVNSDIRNSSFYNNTGIATIFSDGYTEGCNVVDCCFIENNRVDSYDVSCIHNQGKNLLINGCYFENNNGTDINSNGDPSPSGTVDNCIFVNDRALNIGCIDFDITNCSVSVYSFDQLNSACTESFNISIMDDIVMGSAIEITGNVTINGNGHTIVGQGKIIDNNIFNIHGKYVCSFINLNFINFDYAINTWGSDPYATFHINNCNFTNGLCAVALTIHPIAYINHCNFKDIGDDTNSRMACVSEQQSFIYCYNSTFVNSRVAYSSVLGGHIIAKYNSFINLKDNPFILNSNLDKFDANWWVLIIQLTILVQF